MLEWLMDGHLDGLVQEIGGFLNQKNAEKLNTKRGKGSFRRCARSGVPGCRFKAELRADVDGVEMKLCRKHYKKFKIYGSPFVVKRVRG